MKLSDYFSEQNGFIVFTREQASRFAKDIAGDYNPIHNPDSKRFCVPGDLLFACSVRKHGLSEHMQLRFSGMVDSGIALDFRPTDAAEFPVVSDKGKEYLNITRSGSVTHDAERITALTREYVAFSGYTFPHVLVPLMAKKAVMINPARPLIIYESMEIHLDTLDFDGISLEKCDCELNVNGKRGDALLRFRFMDKQGTPIGTGLKTMVLSGLRPYDESAMDDLVETFHAAKIEAA
ncbi:DUF3581 family protein [Granulosicoccaceae sp. 1_MG-2023]|nr:DUF3581 family protein [Granulosicoccaceae sp. 1_MG-2023]